MKPMRKLALVIVGTLCLILGTIGIFLPLLPTTPFLLLSLWCYVRSSEKLYNYVLNNKHLKPYIEDYATGNGIPRHAKIKAISLLWLTIGFSAIFVVNELLVRILLLIIAVTVSFYIGTQNEPGAEVSTEKNIE